MLEKLWSTIKTNSATIVNLTVGGVVLLAAILLISDLGALEQSYKQTAIQNSSKYADRAERQIKEYCSEPSALRQNPNCIEETEQANRNNQISEHELSSQRSDALWNSVMGKAAIAGVAIGVISIWLIFITFKATREAAQAGFRSNDIAENTQRPWIAIEAEIAGFSHVNEHAIEFDFNVRFSNAGQMIAENFYGLVKIVPMSEPVLVHIKQWFDNFCLDEEMQKRNTSIIPGQIFTHPVQSTYAISHLPWCEIEGYRKDCYFMVLAMCRYRIAGKQEWRYSMQSFAVGERRDHIDNYKLIHETINDLTAEKIVLRQLGMTRAT